MSLPKAFSSAEAYLTAAVEFLYEYAWIYEHANTRCLQEGVFERIPKDVVEFFVHHATNEKLNTFPLLHQCQLQLPSMLDTFRKRMQMLTPDPTLHEHIDHDSKESAEARLFKDLRKVSVKKRHEIFKLSELIVDVVDERKSNVILDFGAGLGYLSETMYKRLRSKSANSLLLLGLESEEARVLTAQRRQQQYLPEANGNIVYQQLYIDGNSQTTIEHLLDIHIQGRNNDDIHEQSIVTIVGLHACADLSVTAMEMFLRMSRVRNLIIMPCCYHKLKLQTNAQKFVHFPLSKSLQRAVLKTSHATTIFNRPFLRLACQETSARWTECTAAQHMAHGRAMFWRAVAEVLAQITNTTNVAVVTQSKGPVNITDFAEFCQHYKLRSQKTSGDILPWQQQHAHEFAALQKRYACDVGAKLAEGLTCLQTALQPLCENLVLYDRLCYMEESASATNLRLEVCYRKVLNEKLSPRCYALIACKSYAD